MNERLTHLSLFSGIGGIDLAAHWAGFETVAFVERDEYCQKVLAKNFLGVPIYGDICTVTVARLSEDRVDRPDLVSAGFPCQPHSLAGLRKGSSDERDLWGECVRIVRETEPQWFLGENVYGLLSSEGGRFFGRILSDLAALGYRTGWATYPAAFTGAPHIRFRVFLLAYSDSEPVIRTGVGNSGDEAERQTSQVRSENWFGISLDNKGVAPTKWIAPGLSEYRPLLVRSNDGVPNRMDRRRALGNAVVPQQVYPILKAIAESAQTTGRETDEV